MRQVGGQVGQVRGQVGGTSWRTSWWTSQRTSSRLWWSHHCLKATHAILGFDVVRRLGDQAQNLTTWALGPKCPTSFREPSGKLPGSFRKFYLIFFWIYDRDLTCQRQDLSSQISLSFSLSLSLSLYIYIYTYIHKPYMNMFF